MSRVLFVILAVLLLVPTWSGPDRLPLLRTGVPGISVKRVAIDRDGNRRIGALTYLGGVQLASPDPAFGGFSAMHVAGDRFTLLSDGGGIVRFRMGADWRIRDAGTAELPDGPGTGWEKRDRDSESLAVLGDGSILVGFERANAIWRYAPGFPRALASARPIGMRRWSDNSGAEAMAAMPDGSVVVLSEANGTVKTGYPGLRFLGDPTRPGTRWYRFRYFAEPGFRVTDAVALPDGRLLVLNRAFDPFRLFYARLQIVAAGAIRPGAKVRGRTIAVFEGRVAHDNFEALSLVMENGKPVLWIASDDNQQFWQRSLLLKFRVDVE
ncbi:esterase-like activity of phytase family protein [Sphingomonas sp. VNH70]|uniref:esterase-like activity of phytase family protein n=1 Tax=Sphingomonas silueang TaxID=3156617 RepID=UPI0032B42DB4